MLKMMQIVIEEVDLHLCHDRKNVNDILLKRVSGQDLDLYAEEGTGI